MQRFILLTSGRAGSTSLMDTLASFDDIATPSKQIDCIDNELFHPQFIKKYASQYQALSGITVYDELSLIEVFYQSNSNASYAGFKSMPNRHRKLHELASTGNIKFITLFRDDIASTVASFIIATDRNTWRRKGGKQKNRFVFGAEYKERAFSHLVYIVQSHKLLQSLPNCIHLKYEALCRSDFSDKKLDEYFQRPIKLKSPKQPVSGATYVDNWNDFTAFIKQKLDDIDGY